MEDRLHSAQNSRM